MSSHFFRCSLFLCTEERELLAMLPISDSNNIVRKQKNQFLFYLGNNGVQLFNVFSHQASMRAAQKLLILLWYAFLESEHPENIESGGM